MNVLLVSLSDMHSGGSTALFPDKSMTLKYDDKNAMRLTPSPEQKKLYKHFLQCAERVRKLADGRRIIIVHNGDAIEGMHHNSVQVMTPSPRHQSQIHIELMGTFLDRVGFSVKRGDELHYTSGTESHTGWEEYGIAGHFSALGAQYHDELKLKVNGLEIWYTHHGANAGKGANEGNAHRNWLRDIYFDALKCKASPPDLVITSHFHKCTYNSYSDSFQHTIHGVILPSWQQKTRYAFRAAPFQRNDIGLVTTTITEDGGMQFQRHVK